MRIKRTLPIFLVVVLAAAAITLAVQLRKNAPPEAARLLPGADAFFYADLSWVHKINGGKSEMPVPHDPEYARFIQETGFDYERDLDSAAFAIHYPNSWPGGGTGGSAAEPRFSEVFTARFDSSKCLAYLKQTATSLENYDSIDIFTIPIQGRTFRVAILNVDTVAASNQEDPEVIHGMVDRSRRLASPFGGPALLRHYFKHVQLASPFWIVARVPPLPHQPWSELFTKPVDLVVSASYNPLHLPLHAGALHMLAEAWTATDEDARAVADKANVFLTMFRNAEASVGTGGNDTDLKTFFDSLQIRQADSRAILSATVPTGIFHKLLESPPEMSPPAVAAPVQRGH
ncbi:MAG TPA: hypothetical protein VMX38_17505 [Verrucomicrobiae bacterium]|jgi:hypothetical protein|nr:hypothetical protein [Verrucomicrobiae bacterium]